MPSDSLSTGAVLSRSCLLVLGWMGITGALCGIGHVVVHSHAISEFDRQVTDWMVGHRTPALDGTMKTITWMGSWVTVAVTAGVIVVLVLSKRIAAAVLVLFAVGWGGQYATVNLVKYAVGRPRPPRDLWLVTAHGASFPSGHAANAALLSASAVAAAFLFSRRRPVRATTVTVACLVIVAVGLSRVELGVHWTTDVITGGLATLVWMAAVAGLFATRVPLTAPRIGVDGTGMRRPTD